MMNRMLFVMARRRAIPWLILTLMIAGQRISVAAIPSAESDSNVLVYATTPFGLQVGNGFAVGDGGTIITAAHLLIGKVPSGPTTMKALVTVVSPYSGQASDADVIYADTVQDVALLKVKLDGKPGLRIAEASQIPSDGKTEIVALWRASSGRDGGPTSAPVAVRRADAIILSLSVSKGKPQALTLRVDELVEKGWSGSPVIRPDTGEVVGCVIKTVQHREEGEQKVTINTVASTVYEISPALNTKVLNSAVAQPTSRPSDSDEAFELFVELLGRTVADERAMERGQRLLVLRPKSSVAARLAGVAAEKAGEHAIALQFLRQALALEGSAQNYVYLCQSLCGQGYKSEADALLQRAWSETEGSSAIAAIWLPLLMERKDYSRARDVIDRAIKHNPENGYFWVWSGQIAAGSGDSDEALRSFKKAVLLLPRQGSVEVELAQVLRARGSWDEAAWLYKHAIELEPRNPVLKFAFADALSSRGLEFRDEAIILASEALALPESPQMPREKIERLLNALKAAGKPSSRPTESP